MLFGIPGFPDVPLIIVPLSHLEGHQKYHTNQQIVDLGTHHKSDPQFRRFFLPYHKININFYAQQWSIMDSLKLGNGYTYH